MCPDTVQTGTGTEFEAPEKVETDSCLELVGKDRVSSVEILITGRGVAETVGLEKNGAWWMWRRERVDGRH